MTIRSRQRQKNEDGNKQLEKINKRQMRVKPLWEWMYLCKRCILQPWFFCIFTGMWRQFLRQMEESAGQSADVSPRPGLQRKSLILARTWETQSSDWTTSHSEYIYIYLLSGYKLNSEGQDHCKGSCTPSGTEAKISFDVRRFSLIFSLLPPSSIWCERALRPLGEGYTQYP